MYIFGSSFYLFCFIRYFAIVLCKVVPNKNKKGFIEFQRFSKLFYRLHIYRVKDMQLLFPDMLYICKSAKHRSDASKTRE